MKKIKKYSNPLKKLITKIKFSVFMKIQKLQNYKLIKSNL